MPQLSLALQTRRSTESNRVIGLWLLLCCAMIFVMVVIGGITRLTHSGLSITEWNPVIGAIPPLSQSDWQREFTLYRQTPQYRLENQGMTLGQFKSIFWWEYVHRLWGRSIGLAFLLPLLYFVLRGRVDRALVPRLAMLFVLGGLQGALGWFMVESGLVGRTSVSQYRLAAHLAAALVIYAYMLWLALDLLAGRDAVIGPLGRSSPARSYRRALALCAWIFLVMISGAFVAGLHAGLIYNTFPLMDGKLVPDGLFSRTPFFANFFDDVMTVQFDHRMLAIGTLGLVVLFWLWVPRTGLPPRARLALNLLLAMVFVQVSLGISTLLLVVPIPLAASHQAGALTLLTFALWTAHELREAARSQIRRPG